MTATTPGCGSNSESRKRLAEREQAGDGLAEVLAAHRIGPWRSTVGQGWTLTCSCGEVLPEADRDIHVAAVVRSHYADQQGRAVITDPTVPAALRAHLAGGTR